MNAIDKAFIDKVEADHFRSNEDVGANLNALLIWNRVRNHVGMPELKKSDLPAFCLFHQRYHIIREDYGCERGTAK